MGKKAKNTILATSGHHANECFATNQTLIEAQKIFPITTFPFVNLEGTKEIESKLESLGPHPNPLFLYEILCGYKTSISKTIAPSWDHFEYLNPTGEIKKIVDQIPRHNLILDFHNTRRDQYIVISFPVPNQEPLEGILRDHLTPLENEPIPGYHEVRPGIYQPLKKKPSPIFLAHTLGIPNFAIEVPTFYYEGGLQLLDQEKIKEKNLALLAALCDTL